MKAIFTHRMNSDQRGNAIKGKVVWSPAKSIWTGSLTLIALVAGPLTFTWGAFALFIATTAIAICAGHSVGMHRLLIHRSFEAPKWLEHILVYLGTLVGMAGPFGMIAAHDIRDWAQRQTDCHDLYAHRAGFFQDAWWQMHCAVKLDQPPIFQIEPEVHNDKFYRAIDRTWMLQQVPWVILFYTLGGLPWVVWGVAVRVSVSLTGHWLVGHYAHRRGHQGWVVDGVAVQGYNIRNIGLITFGEGWHGNHHAFPESARLGIEDGQLDPGWWFIRALQYLGLAWNIKEPVQVGEREGLRRLSCSKAPGKLAKAIWLSWLVSTAFVASLVTIFSSANAAIFFASMIFIGIYSAVQYVIIAMPAIAFLSKGAKQNEKVPLPSFMLGGVICAAAPWIILLGLLAQGYAEPSLWLLFILPLCATGALAGWVFGLVIKSQPAKLPETNAVQNLA
jgi:sn-1 stearoyl-lipid 9-desaturase